MKDTDRRVNRSLVSKMLLGGGDGMRETYVGFDHRIGSLGNGLFDASILGSDFDLDFDWNNDGESGILGGMECKVYERESVFHTGLQLLRLVSVSGDGEGCARLSVHGVVENARVHGVVNVSVHDAVENVSDVLDFANVSDVFHSDSVSFQGVW